MSRAHEPSPPPAAPGRTLALVPAGTVDAGLLTWLSTTLGERLGLSCSVGSPLALREEWRDADRGQVRSDLMLDALVQRRGGEEQGHADWLLGVTAADLYAPGRRFVFGEATVGGCCAVIGLARLQPLGDPEAEPLFRLRVLKEAIHELGHVAGLDHCADAGCVMFASPSLAETDRKSSQFCEACTAAAGTLFPGSA